MDTQNLTALYDALCQKAQQTLAQIPPCVPEYPGRTDGRYFDTEESTLRPLSHIFCWTQSFFTGMAALAYAHTREQATRATLNSFAPAYRAKVFDTPEDTMHDLGFLYTLYSTLLFRLNGNAEMREISLRAADVLAGRFVEQGGYLRAWGRMDGAVPAYIDPVLAQDQFFQKSDGLAIIDCMMNLPLLFFAWEQTGQERYKTIAMRHADTTLRYFVRADGSVCHAYRFAPDGAPLAECNGCGHCIGSHWARGAAWAVYGFAAAWRYTGEARYHDAAVRLAETFIALCEPNGMPLWDFRLPPETPALACGISPTQCTWDVADPANKPRAVDTSAAMLMACALHTLPAAAQTTALAGYPARVLQALPEYLTLDPAVPGILRRQNGNDTYTCFGDYFCMELLHLHCNEQPSVIW